MMADMHFRWMLLPCWSLNWMQVMNMPLFWLFSVGGSSSSRLTYKYSDAVIFTVTAKHRRYVKSPNEESPNEESPTTKYPKIQKIILQNVRLLTKCPNPGNSPNLIFLTSFCLVLQIIPSQRPSSSPGLYYKIQYNCN